MAKSSAGRAVRRPRAAKEDHIGSGFTGDQQKAEIGPLQRGFAVLTALLTQQRPLTAAEVADLVGLHSSTAHRLLQTLVEIGYVSRDASKRYLPAAPALFPLNLYHPLNALRRTTFDNLSKLRQRFGLTTALIIFIGGRRVVIEVLPGTDSFSPYYQVEVTVPLYASASGKVFLSSVDPARWPGLVGPEPYAKCGTGTLTDRKTLDREIRLALERGYALSLDEVADGLSGIASPIRAGNGRTIGCVSIAGASKNFDTDFTERIIVAIKQTTDLFSFATPEMAAVWRFLGH